jgi:hypothetical protein
MLGFFAVWELIQWNYTLTNWFGASETFGNPTTLFILGILSIASISIGLVAGYRFIPHKLNLYLTILDRQGLSLALLGLGVILTAAVANHTLKAESLQTIVPFCLLPFFLTLLAGVWGISLGLAIPGLAIGRTDRFDLWQALVSRLCIGILLAGIGYLIWQYFNPGNLIAMSAGAILVIATGGIAIIYDDPASAPPERESPTGKLIHTSGVIFLYISLLIILLTVPTLKNDWLKSTHNRSVQIAESPAGTAGCINDSNSPIFWAGRYAIPERTEPHLRQEIFDLIRQIVEERERSFFLPMRLLFVGLPKLEKDSFFSKANRTIHEADIDESIRRMECHIRKLPLDSVNILTLPQLACRRNHYNLIITWLPSPWPQNEAWPSFASIADSLLSQAASSDVLWFLQQVPADGETDIETKRLIPYLRQKTGKKFEIVTYTSMNGCDWQIIAESQSLQACHLKYFVR